MKRGDYISYIKLGGGDALVDALDDFLGDPVRGSAVYKYHIEQRTR